MTRFARAHGSKASNERQPEEATPWSTFKQQLKTQSAPECRDEDSSLSNTRESSFLQKKHNTETHWAEFDDNSQAKSIVKKKKLKDSVGLSKSLPVGEKSLKGQAKSIVRKKKLKDSINKSSGKNSFEGLNSKYHEFKTFKDNVNLKTKINISNKSKKKKRNTSAEIECSAPAADGNSKTENNISKNSNKKKRNMSAEVECSARADGNSKTESNISKKSKKRKRNMSAEVECNAHADDVCDTEKNAKKLQNNSKKAKHVGNRPADFESSVGLSEAGMGKLGTKQQLKRKRSSLNNQDNGFICSDTNDGGAAILNDSKGSQSCREENEISVKAKRRKQRKEKKNKQNQMKEKMCDSVQTQQVNNIVTDNCTNQQSSRPTLEKKSKRQKRNLKKLITGNEFPGKKRRRKKLIESSTMMINGEEIKVTMFDGFPVRAQDAERLQELRKELITRGLPSADISRTLKLERRKSEKALAREKRKVCFHCRKGGHNLSDCPELNEGANQDASATGICFKCGSTEHTHFQCRVVRGQEFRFAKCFICQEQGHISRQCPDNPRGLYPKGGACKICGDVTHLKKDCPDLLEKKEGDTITLSTAQGDKVEALDEELNNDNQPAGNTPKNKIIKF